MGQLYCFDEHHFSRGPRWEDETDALFCFANKAAELFNSLAGLLDHLYLALFDPCCCAK